MARLDRATRECGCAARAYVVAQGGSVVGYHCLATGAVMAKAAPANVRRNMPDPIPVMVIGLLAVDRRHQGRGIGAGLLKDALRRTLGVSQTARARAVVVHAIDDEAAAAGFCFKIFPTDARTLFLAIADIASALG